MSTKKIQHTPKLYISQPITQFPDIMMQSQYSTRKANVEKQQAKNHLPIEEKEAAPQVTAITEDDSKEVNTIQIPERQEGPSNPFDTKRRSQYTLQRVKHFKDMTINEKLLYLEHFPEQLAPISCLFFTANTTFTGILDSNQEEAIEIILPNHTKTSIKKRELQEIRMLGFR